MITSKNRKRGFTIVELVIVIAVIAILAAVLIPTFSNLVSKANLSADQVAVKNMNTALEIYEVEHGKPNDTYGLGEALSESGYNSDSTPLTKGYSFKWNRLENVMMLVNENNIVEYPEKYKGNTCTAGTYFNLNCPVAKVEDTGAKTLSSSEGNTIKYYLGDNITVDMPLECSFVFNATESATDAAKNQYADWRCDFTVSFDNEITVTEAGQLYLAGQYMHNGTQWEVLDPWMLGNDYHTITAGTEIDLLAAMGWGGNGTPFDYEGICTLVKEFKCGAWANDSFNGTTMTVELRLYQPNPDYDPDNAAGAEAGNAQWLSDVYEVVFVYEYTFQ